jgi:hypothetical protein
MGINTMLDSNRNVIVVVILALIILGPIGYYGILSASGDQADPFLERPDEKYQECIRETTYMRFNHWVLLKEIREQVMRDGNREEIVLKNCKDCHTSRARFCDQCHNTVSLTPDCFDCHNYPEYPEAAPTAQISGQ